MSASGPQIDITLHSIFASRKRNPVEEEKQPQTVAVLPGNFQVYAKIDEESRKDSRLAVSFLLTLNDAKGSVTYEFRGMCNIVGSSADFESIMEARKDSRIPRILDIIYQRMYPVIFMLAGMTTSSYPQSTALLTEMVSSEPIQVHQEAEALPKPEEKPKPVEKPIAAAAKPEENPKMVEKPAAVAKPVAAPAEVEAPKQTVARVKKPEGEKTTPARA